MSDASEAIQETWAISDAGFPENGTPTDKLRFLINYAVLAPSERNAQPWLFRVRGDTVELYADRGRSLPVVDPEDRELTIGCGAALFYLRLALNHFGYEGEIVRFPSEDDSDLLAAVKLGKATSRDPYRELLFQAIPNRHTNRQAFQDTRVPQVLLDELQAAAREEGAWLHIVTDPNSQYAIADLIAEGDHIQWADQEFRTEFADWVHANQDPEPDGIPGYALGMERQESIIAPLVMESFDLSKQIANKDYKFAVAAPSLAVLGTDGDTPADWLHGGEAIARVLLRATVEGVSAAFFNQPIEIPKMRLVIGEVIGTEGFPQLMMRLGYGPQTVATPRRKASEVTLK